MEESRNYRCRERLNFCIVFLCGVVIVLTRNGNTVFGACKLILKIYKILICLEIGIAFGYRQKS